MGEEVTPAWIEKLRQSGISVDREGHFIHEGEPVLHEGLKAALYRWLDRLPPPDGRYVLRLDERRFAYVTVEDTPLVVRGARLVAAHTGGRAGAEAGQDAREEARVELTLSDGVEVLLDPATLRLRPDGSLICAVREGHLEARFATAALAGLQPALGEDDAGAFLQLGARRVRLGIAQGH